MGRPLERILLLHLFRQYPDKDLVLRKPYRDIESFFPAGFRLYHRSGYDLFFKLDIPTYGRIPDRLVVTYLLVRIVFSFARKKEAGVQGAEPLLSYRLICKEFPPPGTGRPKCW